jgi:protease IV
MNFIKNIFSTVIGIFVFLIVCFLLIIGISALFGSSEDKIEVEENSVIELDLSSINFDYAGKYSEPNALEGFVGGNKNIGFIEVLNAIKNAKADENIKGISIINNQTMLGMAQCKEIRDQLVDFKKSGKFIMSYANYFTQKEYYLNSVADQIYLNPMGEVDFKGLASESLFFKDFEDKTGLKMEIIRHGKFKSAVEPFLDNKMSPENREQITVLLTSIWKTIVEDVATSRKLTVPQLNNIADNLLSRTPQMALQNKIIDKIAYEDEYELALKNKLKVDKKDDYESISIADYTENEDSNENSSADDIIAVIYAQGEINGGEGDVDYIGEKSINRALKDAREDDDIKAIVLRVDSPGGSALTSELIWREIELTKKTKPVVVSMGNLAASGGYYIAAGANYIFAEPTTITGSIGVFGMLPNMYGFATKAGINAEQVATHKNASGYSAFEPVSESYKTFALEGVDNIYKTFVSRVMVGRKLTFDQVDAIGQGRVWAGADAIKIGLVDKIGNLNDAINHAAKLGKTKDFTTESFPEYKREPNQFISALSGAKISQTKDELIKQEIGEENFLVLQKIKNLNKRKGMQLIMPYEINIK